MKFHFIDLLGLHLGLDLTVPEGKGVLSLLHHLTDIHLPLVQLYPAQVVALCQHHLRGQFPWLRSVGIPASLTTSAQLWAWVDVLQRRHADPGSDGGRAIPVEPLDPGTIAYRPLPPGEALREFGLRWEGQGEVD